MFRENWQSLCRIIIPLIRNREARSIRNVRNDGYAAIHVFVWTCNSKRKQSVMNEQRRYV